MIFMETDLCFLVMVSFLRVNSRIMTLIKMLEEIGVWVFAVASVLAAFLALWTVKEIRKTTKSALSVIEGQLLVDFLREYSSDAVQESLQTLRNWKRDNKNDYKSVFEDLFKHNDISVIPLNRARRTVFRFFQRMLQLYEGRYVSADFCRTICKMSETDVLFDIVEPFDEIVARNDPNHAYDGATFQKLRSICRNQESVKS